MEYTISWLKTYKFDFFGKKKQQNKTKQKN